ncbi:hypothetical protein ANN_09410 [Periplaneta americana]|uniref:Uncharacterized protein n=1 Tax=Periplaneta americana TaxID=6978 RepID=A0ABQ8TL93_PERAM|nr:hypothetical protein ANN_09410 [Periplaneta americana]
MDLSEVGYVDRDWIDLAQDRDLWRVNVGICKGGNEPPSSLKASKPGVLIPTPPDDITLTEVIQSGPDVQTELQNDPDFVEDDTLNVPDFLTQEDLNDLVRDPGLSKSKAESLASRLKGWKLLQVTPK